MSDNLDLPWSLDLTDGTQIHDNRGGRLIVQPMHDEDFIDLWYEQSKLIVKAVNNHHALVAMVRELRGLVRVTGPLTTARERADELLAGLSDD